MHTAQITEWHKSPVYTEVPDLPPPSVGFKRVKVVASGVHSLDRARASGTHYSATTLPHFPGIDGVGTLDDGQMVYFTTFPAGGAFSEVVHVPEHAIHTLPEGVDPIQVAAFLNPGLSSWMALTTRPQGLEPGFSVLIMGVTSASGMIAVSLARALGAGKVVGCARNTEAMEKLGLDGMIELNSTVSQTDFSAAADVDVVLDYLYGPPAERLLTEIKLEKPLQYIHIGSLAGPDITLPGSTLRSNNLTVRGSGPGAFAVQQLGQQTPSLLKAMKSIAHFPVKEVALRDIEKGWSDKAERTLFVP